MFEVSVIIPIIIALGEVWKIIFGDKVKKFIPLINLALGITAAIVYRGGNLKVAIFEGIIIGLSASGLYSSSKNMIEGFRKQ